MADTRTRGRFYGGRHQDKGRFHGGRHQDNDSLWVTDTKTMAKSMQTLGQFNISLMDDRHWDSLTLVQWMTDTETV